MKNMQIVFLILIIICMIYAVSIFMVGSGTYSFVIWIVGAIFFAVAFYFAGDYRWMRVPTAIRIICYAIISFCIIVFATCFGVMLSHFGDRGEKDLDYLIVLGAQMRGNDPSTIYKFRLDAAYEYLLDNPDTICVVSGGQGVNETVSEGEGGRDYLIKRGIDPARLIAETNAMDTEENIKYSLAVMETAGKDNTGKLRIGVVTNNFHLFRGIHIARNYTDNYVCGIAAGTIPWYLPNNMVRECFGIIRDYQQHIV